MLLYLLFLHYANIWIGLYIKLYISVIVNITRKYYILKVYGHVKKKT